MQTCRTIVVASLLAATVHAQCGLAWRPGVGINGVDDFVYDLTTWDPDGAGPAPLQVVVAGEFLKAGHAVAAHIATWNPATGDWAQLGGGVSGRVQALEIAANGDLIVAGTFYSVGNVSARSIARWNGTAWAALGLGIDGSVADVAALPNGDIVAVGSFTTAGGVLATNVARWNGASWSALGTGTNDRVSAVVALPNGDVVVGGEFTSIGGVAANRIARWNGSAWLPLGTGVDGAPLPQSTIAVYSLARLPNGDLVVGGHFANAGAVAAPYVARWNGSAWSPMGAGLAGVTTSLHVQPNGMLIADSPHTPGATRPSQWNGVSWQPIAPGLVNPYRFATLPNGDLVAGGAFVFTTVGAVLTVFMLKS